jgi:hypothetical protein
MMNTANLMNQVKSMDKTQYIAIGILVIMVLYVSFGIRFLPLRVLKLFTNKYFNFVMFALLAAATCVCPCVGIMFAVALLLTICAAKYPTFESMESMENISAEEYEIAPNADAVTTSAPVMDKDDKECVKVSQYRNDFYPQYVNSDYFAYDSKNNYQGVGGFDASSKYDSFEADNGSRTGLNDGTRSTYDANRSTYN